MKFFQFKYSFGGSEDPVAKAVLANLRGKFVKPDKPKVGIIIILHIWCSTS